MKSGDIVKNLAGKLIEVPFALEQPCFGQHQGWCINRATWRMEGDHMILHFCDRCKSRPGLFAGREFTWIKLSSRSDN